MPKKLTQEEFIKRAKEVHHNIYDYTRTIYTTRKKKIKIICKIHGEFTQTADLHLLGGGCQKCGWNSYATESFIKKAKKIHNNKFDYSQTEYINNISCIKIGYPIHGIFEQTPSEHLKGRGCRKYADELNGDKKRLSVGVLENRAKKIRNNFYSYNLKQYKNLQQLLPITCPIHGVFIR